MDEMNKAVLFVVNVVNVIVLWDSIDVCISNPVNRSDKYFLESFFFRAWCDLVHVLPLSVVRETHKNGFDSRIRSCKTELRASIVHEIELNVATSPDFLPLEILRSVLGILASCDNGIVRA